MNIASAARYEKLDKAGKEDFILRLTEQLIKTITKGDYHGYMELTDRSLTSFEPEAMNHLVSGMDFHKFYFDHVISQNKRSIKTHILQPKVHLLGDTAACIAYVRLTQYIDRENIAKTMQSEETRIWSKKDNKWLNVHFHRTGSPSAPNLTPTPK